MPKWLADGLRRDVCFILYGEDEIRGQELKTQLETVYDERVRQRTFRRKLDRLVDSNHVNQTIDGVHDRYSLSASGQRALEDHVDWLRKETNI